MAFSFNWSGLNVPTISGKRDVQNTAMQFDAAGKLGRAARGWQDRVGMQEYADMIANARRSEDPRIASIEAEIARLEQRNRELEQASSRALEQASAMEGYAPSPAYTASQQMNGYGQYQDGMRNQGMAFPAYDSQHYRTR